jgi:hypothetical protein
VTNSIAATWSVMLFLKGAVYIMENKQFDKDPVVNAKRTKQHGDQYKNTIIKMQQSQNRMSILNGRLISL